MADRWFVVPIVGTGGATDPYRPKYSSTSGLTGYTGNTHYFDESTYSDLPWSGQEMYVVRYYGSTSALDTVAGYDDAYGKQEYSLTDSEVADYLNDKFGVTRTFEEWLGSFQAA